MLSLLVSNAVLASNDALEIRLVSNKEVNLDPGSAFCVAVMLNNFTNTDKKFHVKIKAPEGWNQLMDYSTEDVQASTKKLKIFSFYVPGNAYVGDYNIYITAFNESNNTKIGTAVVPVYVKPKYGVETKTLNTPNYVFAGDTLSVKFLLQNTSNVGTSFKTTVVNNKVSETRNITLPPKSSQVIRVFITTNKDALNLATKTVKITASILGKPKIHSASYCAFKVIPTKQAKFDKYNRIPVRISGLFATNNPNGIRSYGYMFNIQGGGVLIPGKDKRLYFQLRGPNRQGNPVLRQTDKYYASYSTAHSKAVVGDHGFGLTPLTEGSRLGRGVSYQHKFKKIGLGGFVNFPRYYPGLKRVISANGSYFSKEKFKLKLGLLNKTYVSDSAALMLSISGKMKLFSWNDVGFEYAEGMAGGKSSKAFSFDFNINRKALNLFLHFTKADPDFPGYVSNTEFASSGISFTFFHKLRLSANYYFNHTNMALDTMYSNAPFSKEITFSLGYQFSFNSSVSLTAFQSTMEDMNVPKQFYYSSSMAQLAFTTRIKRIQFNLYGSMGKTTNYLQPTGKELAVKMVVNSNISMRYRVNDHVSVSGFVRYLGGEQFINSSFKKYLYGGTLSIVWRNKFKMSLQYQNNYTVQEYYKTRSLIGFVANYDLSKHDEVGAYLNYGLKNDKVKQTQLSASLNFTHLLNVPSSKRKDVGNLHGVITGNGADNVQGLRVTLAGNVAYTDKKGVFDFQNVKIGTHYLFIDVSNAGMDAITTRPGPYKINILPGATVNFNMPLTLSGQIKGKIEVKKDKSLTAQGYTTVKEALKPLIVEVSNGKEVFRTYTDTDGAFCFTDLRPGKWKVKIYDKGIPEGYRLEKEGFDLDLKPHEVKAIPVIVKKIYHKIQFQKSNW